MLNYASALRSRGTSSILTELNLITNRFMILFICFLFSFTQILILFYSAVKILKSLFINQFCIQIGHGIQGWKLQCYTLRGQPENKIWFFTVSLSNLGFTCSQEVWNHAMKYYFIISFLTACSKTSWSSFSIIFVIKYKCLVYSSWQHHIKNSQVITVLKQQ